MRKVPFIDSTGVNNLKNLIERNQKRGIKIILSGVNPTVQGTLHKFGLDKTLSDGCIQPHIIPALAKAKELLHYTLKYGFGLHLIDNGANDLIGVAIDSIIGRNGELYSPLPF